LSLYQKAKTMFAVTFAAATKTAFRVLKPAKSGYWAALFCILLCLAALADYFMSGLARRTFVFRAPDTRQEVIEERMIRRTGSREADISRYVEEALTGPLSPETEPLFGRDVRLEALLLRGGVVFLSVSVEAAVPQSGSLRDNLADLSGGIRRNFPFVKDVRFFIEGNEVLFN
jgi:hypothetical protein